MTLGRLFEAQAARTPDAVALSSSLGDTTYQELNARANRLARLLIARQVRPEYVVGLALPRGAMLITALLAVTKAGGAYLPIDTDYPTARLEFTIADARPAVLLTLADRRDSLAAAAPGVDVIALDDADTAADWDRREATDLIVPVRGDHPLYVLYTSGSTGTPKGVVITHRGLEPLLQSARDCRLASEDARVLQVVSPSFDILLMEMCMSLLVGGVLVLGLSGRPLLGEELAGACAQQRVTHLCAVPTTMSTVSPQDLPSVHTILFAGEALPPALAARWTPGHHVGNAYGPTETTVCVTIAVVGEEDAAAPPIGPVLPGAAGCLLSDALTPVAEGAVGELYISGPKVGRGYLNRPGLTAARFVACPSGPPGARMYRTGDRVRMRPDGQLDFAGRTDDQIKFNGHRVELGELETVLGAHPAVVACAVGLRTDSPQVTRLVAYVVTSPSAPPRPEELRAHMRRSLPDFMVPSLYVPLPELPRLPNGKVDRGALPAPGRTHGRPAPSPATPVVRLQRSLQGQIQEIWCEALVVDSIDIDTGFIDAGGNSVLMVRVNELLKKRLGVEIALTDLLLYPTVRELAEHVAGLAAGETP